MKKIKMKSISAGPDMVMHPGECYTIDADVAKVLVDGGFATYETMTVNPKSIEQAGKSPDVKEIKKAVDAPPTPDKEVEKIEPAVVEKPVKPIWGK